MGQREQVFRVVRPMDVADVEAVARVEEASFRPPIWTKEEFRRVLDDQRWCALVADCGGEVVGFSVYRLLRKSYHLVDFAVAAAAVPRGDGSLLVAAMKEFLRDEDERDRIVVHLHECDARGWHFFRSQGFRASRVVRRFFEDEDGQARDAYLMRWAGRVKADLSPTT